MDVLIYEFSVKLSLFRNLFLLIRELKQGTKWAVKAVKAVFLALFGKGAVKAVV